MKLFLGSFITDWWNTIQSFFHELKENETVIYGLIVSILLMLALLCLMKFLKPMYSADKNKSKVWPIILFAFYLSLACVILFI